jgi:hypothetical protein
MQPLILQAIKDAGPDGIATTEVAANLGTSVRVVKQIVSKLRDKGEPIVTVYIGTCQRRYKWDDSQPAQVKAVEPGTRVGEMAARILAAGPEGISTADVYGGERSPSTQWALQQTVMRGAAFARRWCGGTTGWRYFAKMEWLEEAYAKQVKAYGEKPKALPKVKKPKPAKSLKLAQPKLIAIPPRVGPQGVADYSRARLIVYEVAPKPQHVPAQTFGRIGEYLPAETWAAKVYR